LESLIRVAGHRHQAIAPRSGKLERNNPMKTSYTTWDGKRGSAAQSQAWGAFGDASCMWETLTEDHQECQK
jgi:hypothetical protein